MERGSRIGRYEVEELIGKGGMGAVYRARDTELDRTVAIKVLPQGVADGPTAMLRLKREAEIVRTISSPNVVRMLDVGMVKDRPYLVTEYVNGDTLEQLLRQKGRLTPTDATRYALGVAEALDTVHRRGVIHRDIKPSNILIDEQDTVKLADFGLAALVDVQTDPAMVGTLAYISPEQVVGESVGPASDIYSLGTVLYEMITGTRPFTESNPAAQLSAVLHKPLDSARLRTHASPALAAIVARALEKDPRNRFATSAELASALRALLKGSDLEEQRAGKYDAIMGSIAESRGKLGAVLRVFASVVGLGITGLLVGEAFTTGRGPIVSVALGTTAVVLLYELALLWRRGALLNIKPAVDWRARHD
jgi:serine/threonine protein kinase